MASEADFGGRNGSLQQLIVDFLLLWWWGECWLLRFGWFLRPWQWHLLTTSSSPMALKENI
eukprot:12718100-Ditylum_brightwellii.AAC.1